MIGKWGSYRFDDGTSRPFQPGGADARTLVAEVLARADGWAEIRPRHWRVAGRVVKELKQQHMLRTAREQRAVAAAHYTRRAEVDR